jgi:hypothetical protein
VIASESALPLAGRPSGRPKPISRAAFRARLEDDPRRWVLALAAAEALVVVGFALTYDEKLSRPGLGYDVHWPRVGGSQRRLGVTEELLLQVRSVLARCLRPAND